MVFPADKPVAKQLLQFLKKELFRGPLTETLCETNSNLWDALRYCSLGNWKDCKGNSAIDEELLTDRLKRRGHRRSLVRHSSS